MSDSEILQAAFKQARQLQALYGDAIPWAAIEKGFYYKGKKVHFVSKAIGIFKPAAMSYPKLGASISTMTINPVTTFITTRYKKAVHTKTTIVIFGKRNPLISRSYIFTAYPLATTVLFSLALFLKFSIKEKKTLSAMFLWAPNLIIYCLH